MTPEQTPTAQFEGMAPELSVVPQSGHTPAADAAILAVEAVSKGTATLADENVNPANPKASARTKTIARK